MKTILLVDDSSTLLLSMTTILTKAGYKVEKAENGQKALDKINAGLKPDLVITDLNMPIMDGMTLIKELRKLPGFRFVPILMLTTESQQTKRQEAKKAGATGWLVKPVKAQDLLAVIKRVLPGT
ncbi:response regulator [Desulfohalobiaceae bacterium Ax17]|jgi:two-component system chemotaxis response regulator CheY|uniref:response regulator n=1 Tax=Desulfovulcanus ferrireducens TaxID=2831190 RepID=UPI00207BB58B|nr:response regulator [Desulfovulcanus ferrireducens]MBT8763068.1 response regulator [Desulfovulcanus ferrireducens]